jgi:hypothetical protein
MLPTGRASISNLQVGLAVKMIAKRMLIPEPEELVERHQFLIKSSTG